jgi:hypothetical protein
MKLKKIGETALFQALAKDRGSKATLLRRTLRVSILRVKTSDKRRHHRANS